MLKHEKQLIIEKNDFKFTKIDSTQFNLSFEITNNNIVLQNIINFDLINLIFKLNPNIFVSISMENHELEEDTVTISALLKDIFCELGLPQYYTDLRVKKIIYIPEWDFNIKTFIRFVCIANNTNKTKVLYPKDTESLPIEQIVIDFDIITRHHVKVSCAINLTDDHNLPQFTEKIIGNMIYNIFNKVKQFIENITLNI
jgi:hypothetical protein